MRGTIFYMGSTGVRKVLFPEGEIITVYLSSLGEWLEFRYCGQVLMQLGSDLGDWEIVEESEIELDEDEEWEEAEDAFYEDHPTYIYYGEAEDLCSSKRFYFSFEDVTAWFVSGKTVGEKEVEIDAGNIIYVNFSRSRN